VVLDDFSPAPNITARPDLYELENRALDPDGAVLAAMRTVAPWQGKTLLDLGCGTGYWLPIYANDAAIVIGVEPDIKLLEVAARRDQRAVVVPGSAEHLPFQNASIDVVHARFAYFWPPHCEAGLAEVQRVLRPGGMLVVVDNDQRHGEFAELLGMAANAAQGQADVTDRWWAARGAERIEVMSRWLFTSRADMEAVLGLEFPAPIADRWLLANPGKRSLTYGYVLFAMRKPSVRESGSCA
jgi:SAM-dependent methyltransferase